MRNWHWDIIVFIFALFACARFAFPLLEPEESRYAELARQMLESGSWIVPTLDGQPYLDKPPLLYWLVAVTFKIFGVSVFVARLIPSLVAAVTAWMVYRWGFTVGGRGMGIVSSVILLTLPDYLYRGPMLTMNGLLALATTAALAAGYFAIIHTTFSWKWWNISAICCALGILAKGPASLVIVAGPIVIVPWLDRRFIKPGIVNWIGFGAVILVITVPWFAIIASREPTFLEYFFWKHHIERVVNPFDHVKPWWYYLPQVILGTLPWTPILLKAAVSWLRGRYVPAAVPFGLIGGILGLILFSISGSKRPVYLVPIYPLFAIAAGAYLWNELTIHGRLMRIDRKTWLRFSAILFPIFLTGCFVLLPIYHAKFSAGSVLDQIDHKENIFAVSYSSPAASFAMRRIVPVIQLEHIDSNFLKTHQRFVLIVPPRTGEAVRSLLNGLEFKTIENGEMIAFQVTQSEHEK